MADFNKAIKKTLDFEGSYSNHPADSGGKTKYGITEQTARKHGYQSDMRYLPLETAVKIYKISYWDVLKLDRISNQKIAENMFDVQVNGGNAIRWAQRTINEMRINHCDRAVFTELSKDGIIGPKTIHELNKIDNGKGWEKIFMEIFNYHRMHYYLAIVENKPSQAVFLHGWINRIVKLKGDN